MNRDPDLLLKAHQVYRLGKCLESEVSKGNDRLAFLGSTGPACELQMDSSRASSTALSGYFLILFCIFCQFFDNCPPSMHFVYLSIAISKIICFMAESCCQVQKNIMYM